MGVCVSKPAPAKLPVLPEEDGKGGTVKPTNLNYLPSYMLIFQDERGPLLFYYQPSSDSSSVQWGILGSLREKYPNFCFGVTTANKRLVMCFGTQSQRVLDVPVGHPCKVELAVLGAYPSPFELEAPWFGAVYDTKTGEVWFGTHVKGSNAKGDVVGVIALQRTSVSLIHSWMQYMGARVDLSRRYTKTPYDPKEHGRPPWEPMMWMPTDVEATWRKSKGVDVGGDRNRTAGGPPANLGRARGVPMGCVVQWSSVLAYDELEIKRDRLLEDLWVRLCDGLCDTRPSISELRAAMSS